MPKIVLNKEHEDVQTRNVSTKVKVELSLVINGREIPNSEVLGLALDKAYEQIVEDIKLSYAVIPPRPADGTPLGTKPLVEQTAASPWK